MTCDICIGTSGFHYKHWKGPFYLEKTPATKLLDLSRPVQDQVLHSSIKN